MIIVMSDLHIADTSVSANMPTTFLQKIFAEIISEIRQTGPEKLTLVLNGDIFDTLTSELWLTSQFSQKTAIRVFKKIAETETPREFRKGIKELCSIIPTEIKYVSGNHDLIREFPELREEISDFLEMTMEENIFFASEFFDETTRVYAAHGDRNDNWKIWKSKLGSQMQIWFTVKALSKIREKTGNENFREISDVGEVRPRHRKKFIKAVLGKKNGKTAIAIIRKTGEQFFTSDFAKNAIKAFFSGKPVIAKITEKIVCNRISAGLLTRLLLAYYYSIERDFRNHKQKKEIYRYLQARNIQPKFIVMGHTHEYEHSKITTNTEFINLGYCRDMKSELRKFNKIKGGILIADKKSAKIIKIKNP